MMRFFKLLLVIVYVVTGLAFLSGCSAAASGAQPTSSDTKDTKASDLMVDMQNIQYPDYVANSDVSVQEAYQFVLTHPKEMQKYPCFCGCGRMGHQSNFNCYVKSIDTKGKVTFDNHASGCGICVDITKDVRRLLGEGKSSREVRAYIDAQYGSYGPSTNTVYPTD